MSACLRPGLRATVIVSLVLLSGCGIFRGREEGPRAAEDPAAAVLARIGKLEPRDLRPGNCGMFLWARKAQAELIFFSRAGDSTARMVIDGDEVALIRTLADGQVYFGQHAEQHFAHDDLKLQLDFQLERRGDIVSGGLVREAALRIEDAEGWSVVMPVAGLIACQPVR